MIGKTLTLSKWFQIAACSLLLVSEAVASSGPPPDKRSWEEVTADFVERSGKGFNRTDGKRLKELDSKRAVEFLMSFLAKDKPERLRLEAAGALGCESFQVAIPALSSIAKDVTDSEEVRARALNPGLRYMNHPLAFETAAAVASDKSRFVRATSF
jgi:HEAT repeat protein